MSLKKIISISLIVYVSITALVGVYGLYIAPVRVAQTFPNPDLNLPASHEAADSADGTSAPTTATGQIPADSSSSQTPTPAPTPSAPNTSPAPTPAPTPTPTPTPTPIACGSAGGTCTAAQVATHNSRTNCWMIYNNKYYIVTSYVSQHPGGTSTFTSTSCGHDVTAYLNGSSSLAGQRHTHSGSAYTILSSYYVGPVSG